MSVRRDTDASEPHEKLIFMLFKMERALRLMKARGVTGAIWVVDAGGFSMNWLKPARTKLALDLCMCSARCGRMSLVVGAPWLSLVVVCGCSRGSLA